MKAAVIREVGAAPELADVGEPSGETIEVLAAPINPIDLAVSRGVLASGTELASATVRFKSLSILDHTNFVVPPDELAEHYRRLVSHAVAGEIRLEVERVPLDSVTEAWRRQAEGAGTKLVVEP